MSDKEEPILPKQAPDGEAPPGSLLRKRREEMKMSHADAGGHLGLTRTVIRRLEQNDYKAMAGAVYVRGYLNNYAQLLELDPRPILAAFDDILRRERTLRNMEQPQEEPPANFTPWLLGGVLALSLLVIAIVITVVTL